MPPRQPVVLIADALSPATVAALGDGFDVRHCDGTDRAGLLAAVADADALMVRSGTRVDAEVLAAAPRLRVVARAGTGLDTIDVRAATAAGVMVVTAPTANLVSAAELTVGLLLAAARHIPQAHQALREGEWERSRFTGTELAGKTVGVLGLGRVGVLVAHRLAAFGMQVIAHDPYVSVGRAAQLGVRMVDLDTLLTTIVTRADVSQGKPAPEGYLLAARRLGVAPQQCLVVEDSPTGAAAGCAAGMQVIYHPQFPDPSPPPGARYVAPDQPPVPLIETFLTQKDPL